MHLRTLPSEIAAKCAAESWSGWADVAAFAETEFRALMKTDAGYIQKSMIFGTAQTARDEADMGRRMSAHGPAVQHEIYCYTAINSGATELGLIKAAFPVGADANQTAAATSMEFGSIVGIILLKITARAQNDKEKQELGKKYSINDLCVRLKQLAPSISSQSLVSFYERDIPLPPEVRGIFMGLFAKAFGEPAKPVEGEKPSNG